MPPLLAPILRERVLCIAMLLSAVGLLLFYVLGWGGWQCPFLAATGKPCPGCGFTRGAVALLQGDLRSAWQHHPFVLLALPLFIVLLIGAAAPEPFKQRFLHRLDKVERRTAITHLLVLAFLAFGLWRILTAG